MREQRSAKLIDKQVQGGLVLRMLGYFLIFLGISVVVAFFLQLLTDPLQPFSQQVKNIWKYQGPFLITALCLLPVFANDMVKFSHRFVGPIFRTSGVLRRAADGQIDPPFKFREKDYWQDLATDLNRVLDRLRDLENQETETAEVSAEEHETSSRL